jgi:hypothetical protein
MISPLRVEMLMALFQRPSRPRNAFGSDIVQVRVIRANMTRFAAPLGIGVMVAFAGFAASQSIARPRAALVPAKNSPSRLPEIRASLAPQDGMEVLRRMVRAYKALPAFQQRSVAETTLDFGKRMLAHQVITLKVKRHPDMLSMTVKDPRGSLQYYADGKNVIRYLGISNTFTRTLVGPGLQAAVKAMNKHEPQVMSPLVFQSGGDIPEGVQNARMVGTENLNGNETVVVEGSFSNDYMSALGKSVARIGLTPTANTFKVWIDRRTLLLRKSNLTLGWRGPSIMSGSRVVQPAASITQQIVETVEDIAVNPPLGPSDFKFVAPKGAEEVTH